MNNNKNSCIHQNICNTIPKRSCKNCLDYLNKDILLNNKEECTDDLSVDKYIKLSDVILVLCTGCANYMTDKCLTCREKLLLNRLSGTFKG